MDGATFKDFGYCGIGAVIRNDRGQNLWNHRNLIRHGGQRKESNKIAKEAAKYIKEVRQDDIPKANPPHTTLATWSPPRQGFYKLNVDGATFKDFGYCGIGAVIRNDRGQVMGAMCKRTELPLKALETEAVAVEKGILLAWDLGLKDIVIESDSMVVTSAFSKATSPPWSIQKVLEGTHQSLSWFNNWSVAHFNRNGNRAAHMLARSAKSVLGSVIWVEDTPPPQLSQSNCSMM
ncbi:uncharacterized protein LOC142606373 [Castanea sativa]|uniref:uncharacterized protein LOC142606373 n=1 Tax=Castanea sativa TaxID=21020 RepID=UPI003F64C483